MEWISVTERLPEIGVEVFVLRYNQYSKKNDRLTAYLHEAKPEGQEYGRPILGGYAKTYERYWSVPAIQLLNVFSHWMPMPEVPEHLKTFKPINFPYDNK